MAGVLRDRKKPVILRIKPHNPWKARIGWAIVILVAIAWAADHYYRHPGDLPEWAARTPLGRDLNTTTVYKWQDPEGHWHVTDEPPPAGTSYQTESYRRDANVIPPLVRERGD